MLDFYYTLHSAEIMTEGKSKVGSGIRIRRHLNLALFFRPVMFDDKFPRLFQCQSKGRCRHTCA